MDHMLRVRENTGLEWAATFSEPAFCADACPFGQPGSEFPCPAVFGRETADNIKNYIEARNGYDQRCGELAASTIPTIRSLAAACAIRISQNGQSPIELQKGARIGDIRFARNPYPADDLDNLL